VSLRRIYRLYRQEALAVRRRIQPGVPMIAPTRMNDRWSLDVLLDTLEEDRRVRLLAVADGFARACLAIEVDTSIGSQRVVEVF